jgi:PTH1 family peptidyl-tRNA hydrolase
MNISGAALAVAWKAFNSQAGGGLEPKLVVLHDELELPLGQAKTKPGSQSPKGHNGLKSIRDLMRGVDYTRIGLGIGRPTSRDPDVVAGYVLRKMSPAEKAALVQLGGEGGKVTELVRQLAGDA